MSRGDLFGPPLFPCKRLLRKCNCFQKGMSNWETDVSILPGSGAFQGGSANSPSLWVSQPFVGSKKKGRGCAGWERHEGTETDLDEETFLSSAFPKKWEFHKVAFLRYRILPLNLSLLEFSFTSAQTDTWPVLITGAFSLLNHEGKLW